MYFLNRPRAGTPEPKNNVQEPMTNCFNYKYRFKTNYLVNLVLTIGNISGKWQESSD